MTINRLLVANRGEIARRVFASCRRLGIETVAVFSDADAGLPFVREADSAVRLSGSSPAETYLRGDLVVEAARRAGADAVHPGYGFLSENATFARQVLDAGLTWVGPDPASIEAMGSKVEAKKLMAAAGVPVLEELSPDVVTERDLPLLVKASAGGGGRGMRVVHSLEEVAAQVELASNEAGSAFGDPTVFCEPYVERGRHVEVQVVGDRHGNVLVLGERDCSLQRRHQKIVEETPAPGLPDEVRATLHEAARRAAEAIAYVGAGTVEFMVAGDRVYFLEMNTRLQVEHPVTECVWGVDLVELQVAVAEGYDVSRGSTSEGDVPRGTTGHAVEVRLYAEDPAAGWQPQSGRLTRFEVPGVTAEFARLGEFGLRLDAGYQAGSEVSTHYDAMLAKVIAWAPTRDQALRRLAGALFAAELHGVRTNRDLLVNLLRDPIVVAGDMHTTYLDTADVAALAARPAGAQAREVSAFAAAVALAERDRSARKVQRRVPSGWRNVASQPLVTRFDAGGDEVEVRWHGGRDGYRSADLAVRVEQATSTAVLLADESGVTRRFEVYVDPDDTARVDVESSLGHVAVRRLPRFVDPADQVAAGSLLAPMPGSVVSVAVEAGRQVAAGQPVLVLEAMKMQHTVTAPHDGLVTEIPVTVGAQVAAGAVLAVVQPEQDPAEGDQA